MMKRYIAILVALVAMTTGAWALTDSDYGIKIGGSTIHAGYYQSTIWYYDPTNNVLHLTENKNSTYYGTVPYIEVDASLNSNLTIQVDGEHIINIVGTAKAIVFKGEGMYTICGQGTLTINPSRINVQDLISSVSGNTSLTIKDLTINITTYGSADNGFSNINYSEINLDHCEINIKSGWCAWFGNSSNYSSANPVLKDCYLVNGVFNGGGVVEYVGSGEWMKEISIKRQYPITNVAITVDNPTAGEVVPNSCQIDNEHCTAELSWEIVTGENSFNNVKPGTVFELGKVYRAVVLLSSKDGRAYPFSSDASITINGHRASVNVTENRAAAVVTYIYPQLANTYYDLWIGGKQVNDINQNDVLGDGGSVRYKKLLGLHYLYLNNATIKNTGNSQLEYTGYGRGIYSTMSGLSVSVKGDNTIESTGEGIYFTGNLSLLGGKDTDNTLSIKGSSGIKTNSQGTALQVYNMRLTAEATSDSGIGIGGTPSFSSNNMNCTMTVSGAKTVVKASGQYLSLGRLKDLVLEDGLQIVRPSGAYFANNNVRDASGTVICGPWVFIMGDTSITTGLNEASPLENGQAESDNGQRDERYNLSGQRVGKDYKGIVIQNGKKVVIK